MLVAGGDAGGTAEIYDPATDSFSATGSMTAARSGHTASLLTNGRVLIIGGTVGGSAVATTEIYDPAAGTFSAGSAMNAARSGQTATTLADGSVVVIAGDASGSIEIYDPLSNTFSSLAVSLASPRSGHAAAVLQNGDILVVGGIAPDGSNVQTGEIVDLANGAVSAVSNTMADAHNHASLRVLSDGKVQIIGGTDHADMEIYDPAINAFGAHSHVFPIGDSHPELVQQITDAPTRAALFYRGASGALLDREGQTITELPASNKALVVGGTDSSGAVLSSSSLLNSSPASITTDKLDYAPGTPVVVTGTGFAPNETVSLTFHEDPHPATENPHTFTVTTDANGNFTDQQYAPEDSDVGIAYVLAAVGGTSGYTAQTTLHDAAVKTALISVDKSDCATNSTAFILGDTVCANVAVTVNGSGTDTYFIQWYRPGNVQVRQTSNTVSGNTTNTDSLTLGGPNANVGTWTITTCAVSGSTCAINKTLDSKTFTAGQGSTNTALSSSENPASSGNPVTFTASVTRSAGTATPTGTVQFKDGASNLGSPVSVNASAQAMFTTSTLSVATHSITAVYSGDTNYASSTSAVLSQVINAPTCAGICSSDIWSTEASMPLAHGGSVSAAVNGKVYVISGFISGETHEVDEYDPSTGVWTARAPIPTARSYAGATELNGKIYVVGGCSSNQDCRIGTTGVVEVYDPVGNSWSPAAPLNTPRSAFAIGTVNGKIVVAGGREACGFICPDAPTTEVYDPVANSWTVKATMPTVRNTVGSAVLNGQLYVVGGSSAGSTSSAVEAYDPSTDQWSTLAALPEVRTALGAAAIGGKLYAISGQTPTDTTSKIVEVYDPLTNSWFLASPIPTPRFMPAAVSTNGKIYIAGNGGGNAAISTFESYKPSNLSGMVAWYPGNNNTNDVMGGNNGTLAGGASYVSGKVNPAFNFSGVGDVMTAPNTTALQLTNAITIDAWIKPNSMTQPQGAGVVAKGSFRNGAYAIDIIAGIPGELRFFFYTDDDTHYQVLAPGWLTADKIGTWHHIAATFDSTTGDILLYDNGTLIGTASGIDKPAPGVVMGVNSHELSIGSRQNSGNGGGEGVYDLTFNGSVDEVEIFNRALSAAEIKSIYDASFLGKCNSAPVAADQSVATNANTPLQITLSATDAEGNFLNYIVNNGSVATAHGTLSATNSSTLTYTPSPGYSGSDSFTFKVNDGFVDSNTATVSIDVHCTGPTITTNPAAVTVTYGGNAAFTVAADGVPSPNSYQWEVSTNGGPFTQLNSGPGISGTNTATLTLTAPSASLSGSLYRAVVTSSCATATSAAAPLTVNPKSLSASIIGNPTKVYDGNTSATLAPANFSVSGIVGAESFTVNQTSGTFGPDADAGSKTVTAALTPANFAPGSGTSVTNYTFPTSATGSGTITPAATNLVAIAVTGTYGGTVTLTATLTRTSVPVGVLSGKTVMFTLNGNTVGSAPTDATGVASLPNVYLTSNGNSTGTRISAGTYPAGVGASFATENNYTGSSDSKSLTVQQKSVTASVTASSKVYDGTDAASIATCTPAVIEAADDLTCFATGTNTFDNKNAGAAKTVTARNIQLSGASVSNYALSATTETTTADILTKGITATLAAADKVYDGSTTEPDVNMSCSLTGVVSADAMHVSCTPSAGSFNTKDVATANQVTATVTIGDTESGNYTLGLTDGSVVNSTSAVASANITRRTLTASIIGNPTKSYDGTTVATLTPTNFELLNVVSGEGFTVTQTVGSYNDANVLLATTVIATLAAGDFTPNANTSASNYILPTSATGPGSITQRPATWTTNPASKTYGDADPSPLTTGSGGNFVATDNITASYSRAVGENVGTYHITTTLSDPLAHLTNYIVTNDGADFTINKRAATWTTSPAAKTYGDADPAPLTTGSGANFIAADNITASYTRVLGEDVGSYHITATLNASPLSTLDNYLITNNGATFTVAAATLSVDAVSSAKIYGDADPPLTYILSGFKFDQDETSAHVTGTGSCTRATGETVAGSPYSISCVPGTLAAANYIFAAGAPADFTITPATLKVNAVANTKTYGDTDPTFAYILSGFKFADTDTTSGISGAASCSRSAGESVAGNPYTITCGPGTLTAPNYVFATGPTASFIINQRPATWTTNPASKTYGDADPSPLTTGSGSNFVDPVSATYSRVAGEQASLPTYHITATLIAAPGVLDNYIVTDNGAEFTINQRPLDITVSDQTKFYGDVFAFAGNEFTTGPGQIVGGDSVASVTLASPGAVATASIGGYPITATSAIGTGLSNYVITYHDGTLAVNKRPVTIAADAKSKTYGDSDPPLTYQITSGNLVNGDTLSGALARDAGEAVGNYAIAQGTLSASDNYTVSFTGNTLSISRKSASVTPDASSKTYGNADAALTGTLDGFLPADNVTAAYSRTSGENFGNYIISATLSPTGVLDNYDITYDTATFTINKRNATWTTNDNGKTFGDADPASITTGFGTNFVLSDGVSASYTRVPGEWLGTYHITATLSSSAPGALNNYVITNNGGTFTITNTAPSGLDVTGSTINENGTATVGGSFVDPDVHQPHTVTVTWNDSGATSNITVPAGTNTFSATYQYLDDNPTATASDVYNVTVSVFDGAATVTGGTTVIVINVNPVIASITGAPSAPIQMGSSVSLVVNFTDVGTRDTHTCSFNWDDGGPAVAGTISETNGSGTCSGSKTFTAPGVYTVTAGVADDDTGTTSAGLASQYIVVFDPSAGFVTGGGWINSLEGACKLDWCTNATVGKANFGFVSKYKKGSSTPDGQTEFQFQAGNLNFHSSAYDAGSLVVSGYKAQYKGTGTINGVDGYRFILTAYDGNVSGGGGVDKFRMKILLGTKVVYDNVWAAPDDVDSANPMAIAGGSINIQKN